MRLPLREKLFTWFKKFFLLPVRTLELVSSAFIVKKDGKEIAVLTRDGNFISLLNEDKKEEASREVDKDG